jgi:transcriptional regulator with XRE-family HTH domain
MPRKKARPHYPERDREVFRVLRAIRGMSAPELSRKTFLSSTTVYNLRKAGPTATRYPRHLTLVALAEAAGLAYTLIPIDEAKDREAQAKAERRAEARLN